MDDRGEFLYRDIHLLQPGFSTRTGSAATFARGTAAAESYGSAGSTAIGGDLSRRRPLLEYPEGRPSFIHQGGDQTKPAWSDFRRDRRGDTSPSSDGTRGLRPQRAISYGGLNRYSEVSSWRS